MAGALRDLRGGIVGLLRLSRDLWEALEADLLSVGVLLADVPARVGWRAILAFTRTAPRSSALYRVAHPETQEWTPTDYLLAEVVDQLQYLRYAWAGKGATQPDPIHRPGVPDQKSTTTFGGSHLTTEQVRARLGWKKV